MVSGLNFIQSSLIRLLSKLNLNQNEKLLRKSLYPHSQIFAFELLPVTSWHDVEIFRFLTLGYTKPISLLIIPFVGVRLGTNYIPPPYFF